MRELYENAKSFILKNYSGILDEKTLDILTVSVMALFVRLPEVSQDKLPYILNKLEIFFENKSIHQMVIDKYPEYPTNEITKTTKAFVIRALKFEDDENIDEEWSMYISTSDITNGAVDAIAKSVHELIHLLRFNGIVNVDKEIKVRDGVSIARYNKENKTLKRKHYNIEEGIVEDFTIQAVTLLYNFIKNEDVSFSPSLSLLKNKFQRDFKPSYEIARFLLEGLNRDSEFNKLLEYSFVDENEPLLLIRYYNDVCESPSSFSMLSRELDSFIECANKEDVNSFKIKYSQLIDQINEFLKKAYKKKRK